MQTLRDATILLLLLLVLASVRVSRVEPVRFDLVPEARASSSAPTPDTPAVDRATHPASVDPIAAPDASRTASPGDCQVRTLRLGTLEQGSRVIAIRCDLPRSVPTSKASKIG